MSGYTPKETLELMLRHLGLACEVREEERPTGAVLHVLTPEPGRLIGRNGKTLEDLQYLLNRMLSHVDDEGQRITVDVENYRLQQYAGLFQQVEEAAESVRNGGEPVTLPPMNSFERRLVHNLYKDDPTIATSSPAEPARLKSITIRQRPPK